MKIVLLLGTICLAAMVGWSRVLGASGGDPQRRAAALAWEMTEIHHRFSDQRMSRGMTAERERTLADDAARKLAKIRDELAALSARLPTATRFSTDVAAFVKRWPSQQALFAELSNATHGEALGVAITSLAMQVSDPRRGWKTLFPFLRP